MSLADEKIEYETTTYYAENQPAWVEARISLPYKVWCTLESSEAFQDAVKSEGAGK